jgi:hypothetical protein
MIHESYHGQKSFIERNGTEQTIKCQLIFVDQLSKRKKSVLDIKVRLVLGCSEDSKTLP